MAFNPVQPIIDLGKLFSLFEKLFGYANNWTNPETLIKAVTGLDLALPKESILDVTNIERFGINHTSDLLIKLILEEPLGIAETPGPTGTQNAFDVMRRVAGFSLQLELMSFALDFFGKAVFGHRGSEALSQTLGRLPEELGLNFFIGSVLHDLYITAVGKPLEEAINVAHHPARLDAMTFRRLARLHVIDEATVREMLDLLGYPDEYKGWLMALADQTLSVSDVQQAYLQGLMSEEQARSWLDKLGFPPDDIDMLIQLYLRRAETQGGDLLRSVARTAYSNRHITEAQFRDRLTEANVPAKSIDLEVEAIKLEQSTARQQLTLDQMKQAYLHGDISRDNLIQRLTDKEYALEDAQLIATAWEQESAKTITVLSESRILQYLLSGVITPAKAYDMLLSLGLRPDDARFIVDHPSATGSTYRYDLTPQIVLSALKDTVISVDYAREKLRELNVEPETADLEIRIAQAQQSRNKKTQQPQKLLTVGDVRELFDNGLIGEAYAVRELTLIGYSDSDSNLLVAGWITKRDGNLPAGWIVLN